MDDNVLEEIFQERLEERIIAYLAEKNNFEYQKAMDIYYSSELAGKIHEGRYGVQYLDYKILVDILEETEPNLLKR